MIRERRAHHAANCSSLERFGYCHQGAAEQVLAARLHALVDPDDVISAGGDGVGARDLIDCWPLTRSIMNTLLHGHCVAVSRFAPWALALLVAGCAADDSQSSPSSAPDIASGGSSSPGSGGQAASAAGGAGTVASGGSAQASGNINGGLNAGAGGNGATDSAGGSGGAAGPGGADRADAGTGVANGSETTTGGVARTVELIGPGTAPCGATNATHGDGFVCILNYPSEGPNVVGYWFDYAFAADTCTVAFTKPAGNDDPNPQVCFSGSACQATSGGGLGVALCDVHGIDVSTWPELAMLETTSELSSTLKSPFSGCNPGATITSVSWALGSGSIPSGTSVLFDDASDVTVARVDNLPAGATSADLPSNVDASQIATIKFSVDGASSTSWDFCLTSVTVSMR